LFTVLSVTGGYPFGEEANMASLVVRVLSGCGCCGRPTDSLACTVEVPAGGETGPTAVSVTNVDLVEQPVAMESQSRAQRASLNRRTSSLGALRDFVSNVTSSPPAQQSSGGDDDDDDDDEPSPKPPQAKKSTSPIPLLSQPAQQLTRPPSTGAGNNAGLEVDTNLGNRPVRVNNVSPMAQSSPSFAKTAPLSPEEGSNQQEITARNFVSALEQGVVVIKHDRKGRSRLRELYTADGGITFSWREPSKKGGHEKKLSNGGVFGKDRTDYAFEGVIEVRQ